MATTIKENEIVIVGRGKPLLNYGTACITSFNAGRQELTLRARGDAINSSVEVVRLLKSKFIPDLEISDAKISSDHLKSKEGRSLNLPVLELVLSRK